MMMLWVVLTAWSGPGVHLNQVGFQPDQQKLAVVVDATSDVFTIYDPDNIVVLEGTLSPEVVWPFSGEAVRVAEFSALQSEGEFNLIVGESKTALTVGRFCYSDLATAALKAYYFQRCSEALPGPFAGKWARLAGHPDNHVLIHESAKSKQRPAGTVIQSSGGWYDAGDYNKYIVSTSISVWSLLTAYDHFPDYFDSRSSGIPESNNAIPDILDEAQYALRWMLTMQDPHDGGVYHKLTSLGFEGMVMPHEATKQRFVVAKSTAATLDFCATMARAARIYGNQPNCKALADTFRKAALSAWRWGSDHPQNLYIQPDDVVTGTYSYDHEDLKDEWFWAAVECFLTTGDEAYLLRVDLAMPNAVPSWDYVAPLGWISLATHSRPLDKVYGKLARNKVTAVADHLSHQAQTSGYRIAMGAYPKRFISGANERDFSWGSNGVAGYQGLLLLVAHRITGKTEYLTAAYSNLDYLLGRNPRGICYVTGFGRKSPLHPHHRPSAGDAIAEPVPGWLVGGPHDGLQDVRHCPEGIYSSSLPANAYIDHVCSYATNEVAINWNAPLVYLTAGIQAHQGK